MKILVIGGSYFLGRVFVMQAAGRHEITVVNRGNQPLTGIKVREIHGDRHDVSLWQGITEDFDVLVDFCGYHAGDIRTVAEHLAGSVKQYLFISTVDVYEHNKPGVRTEGAPFETVCFPGEAGEYIAGKVALERELAEVCASWGIQGTVLRPAFLYGPLNYAPRETVFIRLMAQDNILPVIAGADGKFQFLYVKDGAEAIERCLLNERTYGQAYNLCGDEIADYGMLADVLQRAARRLARDNEERQEQETAVEPVRMFEVPLAQAQSQGFPLPFPVSEAESLLCSNEKSKQELGMNYLSLEEGMDRTYRIFRDIFRQES